MAAPMPAMGSSASRARLVLVLELHLHAGWLSTSGSRQLFVSMEVLEDEETARAEDGPAPVPRCGSMASDRSRRELVACVSQAHVGLLRRSADEAGRFTDGTEGVNL